jgi:hypothetical protein
VRLIVSRGDLEPAPGQFAFEALEARLATYRALPDVDVYVEIDAPAPAPEAMGEWARFLRALAARAGPGVRGYLIRAPPGDQAGGRAQARAVAFFIKTSAIELRAQQPDAAIGLAGVGATGSADATAAWLDALYADDIAPYVDVVGFAPAATAAALAAAVERRDPGCATVVLGASLGEGAEGAAARFATAHLRVLGTHITGVTYAASPDVIAAAMPTVAFLRDLIDQPMSTLADAAAGLVISRHAGAAGGTAGAAGGTTDADPAEGAQTPDIPHRLLFGLDSLSSYLILFGPTPPVEIAINDLTGAVPVVRDSLARTRRAPETFARDAAGRRVTLRLAAAASPLIVDWSLPDGTARAERTDVSVSVLPSVAEIIARHQQAQTTQDVRLAAYITDATMTQHFRPNAADPGWEVVTENRFFVQGTQAEFEERSFRLNGTRWGADRPPFPLIQAEKVLSLPLDLRLTSDYRYTLDGVADVNGRECYVVRFDPVRDDQSLLRGTVWIDRQTFLKRKVHTIQTELAVPILTSEETQHFSRVGAIGGQDVYLVTALVGRQNILVAGRSLLVERLIDFNDFRLNPGEFEAERAAARAGDRLMYRDTDAGLRPFVKRDGERVVQERPTTSAKAMLLGVSFDPSYDFPLPLGGINYLDFEFLGPDSQLAVVFGGVLALINVQKPKLLGDRVDGSVDLFAIAVPGSDRVYDAGGDRPDERVLTIPFSTGANLGWRVTERIRLTASYRFEYTWFFADRTTAPTFVVPSSTVTHGLGLGLEWRRAGYAFAANWSAHARSDWRAWGLAGTFDPGLKTYRRQSASLTKDIVNGIHTMHLNAAYYGGQRLDRFSQYQFGMFEEHRIRGVPASGVRFSDLAMARGSYAVNLFDQYRAEIALDQAFGLDPSVGRDWQRITGVGFGFLTRGPFRTMIRGDIGKSFLPDRYRKPGSLVFQIQILKPL